MNQTQLIELLRREKKKRTKCIMTKFYVKPMTGVGGFLINVICKVEEWSVEYDQSYSKSTAKFTFFSQQKECEYFKVTPIKTVTVTNYLLYHLL